MSHPTFKQESLHRLFTRLVGLGFDDLQLADPYLRAYVSDLLVRFARTDALYQIGDPAGQRIDTVVGLLIEAERSGNTDAHSSFATLRHTGDYALFMCGIFRNHVERNGYLDWYLSEGPRSYRRACSLADREEDREMLEHLWRDFEQIAGALDYVRKVYFGRAAVQEGLDGLVRRFSWWN